MKKIILGMLLAVCMMVIVMPMTVYAKRWCEICNNWQDTTVIWKYGDEEHHLGFSTCKKCGTTVESGWEYHSGSGTATCTRGITCDVCGSQYGVLGHDYKLISTRPATCILAGTRIYQCSRCSDSYSEPIPAPGHDMEEVVYTKATCTKEGVNAYLCRNNCGYFYTVRIDATGHDWYSNWITDENNHWHKCNVCNEKKDVSEHTWDSGSITIPATCTTPGLKTYTCTVCCDRVKTEVIAAPGHALCLHGEQKPTCTTVGWNNYYTCMNCDYTTYQEIAATDHSWNTDFTIDQPATCTEAGSKSIHCRNCDAVKGATEIPATGHSFGEWQTVTAPTCTENGSEERICSVCQTKENREISAINHDWDEGTVTKPATCTEEGTKTYICKNDDTHSYEEPIAATGHSWNTDFTIDQPATCTETGSQSIHCRNCDAVKDATEIPATGHSFGEWQTVTAPTCTENGSEERICSVCQTKENREISAINHDWDEGTVTKPATCTEEGTKTYICKNDDTHSYEEPIPATGHSWDTDFTIDQAATCTETGSQSIHCQNCDAVKDATEIPATGHSFGEWQTVTAPTCTENGSEERICSVCQTKETREISAINHDWDEGKITTEPTVGQVGIKTYTCKNCNATKTEEVPKLPATEPETEPATEPETEPATEPETEPATEPETEPVTEPETEPTTEPTTKKPHEIPETEAAPKTEQPANPTTTAAPKTGDDTNVTLWILLAVLSAGSFALLGKRKKYR